MQHLHTQSLAIFIFAIMSTAYLVPKIIRIVRFKKLMDNPNERSSHTQATPSLGGMAFYIVLMLSMYFNYSYDTFNTSISLYPAITILFFLGLKDDLVVLAPRTKIIGQIIASMFLLINTRFEITSFHGFLGIDEIPVWASIVLGLFIMLAVINSFNLIDGIDGLAASVGIVSFSGFAFVFFFAERNFWALTCVTMVGVLIGFLFFNLSARNRIFMGDTGSMLVGFMLGAMAVRCLSLDTQSLGLLPFNAVDVPIMITAFLIIPLYDTTRVFIVRIMNGQSPFTPDRNHMHHVLIDGHGVSHRRASFFIATTNFLCVAVVAAVMKTTNVYIALTVILFIVVLASIYLYKLKELIRAKAGIPKRTFSRSGDKRLQEQRLLLMNGSEEFLPVKEFQR